MLKASHPKVSVKRPRTNNNNNNKNKAKGTDKMRADWDFSFIVFMFLCCFFCCWNCVQNEIYIFRIGSVRWPAFLLFKLVFICMFCCWLCISSILVSQLFDDPFSLHISLFYHFVFVFTGFLMVSTSFKRLLYILF